MGFTTNSLQIESVTPEKAAEFLKANYERNRRFRPRWVEYLAREMREGRFMPTAEIHIMYRNGDPVMINGQHTCRAIIMYGKPVRVTVRKTTTTEAGQIAMTYAFGHDAGIQRTFADGMNAYGLSEQTGLTPSMINKLTAALRYIKKNFQARNAKGISQVKDSPADLVNYVLHLAPTLKVFHSSFMPSDSDMHWQLLRRSALSVGILTTFYQPEKSINFWSQVARPDGLPWNDARVTARKYIEGRTGNTSSDDDAKLSRQIARCWKAYCQDEKIANVNNLKTDAPIAIYGTPYTGKQAPDMLPDIYIARELICAPMKVAA